MGKITLFLFFFTLNLLSAQNIYEIAWQEGVALSVASPTIEIGDTIIWTWKENSSKSVTSINGTESFDSGFLKGTNNDFAYTFLKQGSTEYQNDSNPLMRGKVTVVPKLSAEEKFIKNLNFYPNPVKSELVISSLFKVETYQIYNVLGTLVSQGTGSGTNTLVDMSRLDSGLYFVKVTAKNMQTSMKIAKK